MAVEARGDRAAALLRVLDDLARSATQDPAAALKELLDATRVALGATRAEVRQDHAARGSVVADDELRTPLRQGSRVLGVLVINLAQSAPPWSAVDRLFVAAVAERASLLTAAIDLREREAGIAGRTQMEDALRASEESYRTIFDLSNDAIFVHDLETGAVLDANRRACEYVGASLAELKEEGLDLIAGAEPPFTRELALQHLALAAAASQHSGRRSSSGHGARHQRPQTRGAGIAALA
ncbi:MAG: PAS domain-containing protein [Longimicrobiales bacterium]